MLHFLKNENIFNISAQAIVNPVNCNGIMGKGLAWQFKQLYPENYKEYRKYCKLNLLHVGIAFVFRRRGKDYPSYIINLPTKKDWRGRSDISQMELILNGLSRNIKRYNLQSVAVPKLGCGYGGLNWENVKPFFIAQLAELNADIFVCENIDGLPSIS